MRIVAGDLRGRKLQAPDTDTTRPTSDRVREAMFNALYSLDDAANGARVLDLYAGSGALGIESLSRGAEHVTFVERDQRALRCLEANLDALRIDRANVTVVRADALDWLAAATAHQFDLALIDPPYDFDAWDRVLHTVRAGLAVIESNREVSNVVEAAEDWELIRHRRYGGTVVTIVRRLQPD